MKISVISIRDKVTGTADDAVVWIEEIASFFEENVKFYLEVSEEDVTFSHLSSQMPWILSMNPMGLCTPQLKTPTFKEITITIKK